MFKHICKLVWNRKRINFLITLEIFVSFLVVFAVIVTAVYYLSIYNKPLGFDYQNVWAIQTIVGRGEARETADMKALEIDRTKRILAAVREFPEVESVAAGNLVPYSKGNWTSCNTFNGRNVCYNSNKVSDDFREVMKIETLRGRWFSKEDDGANYLPVVINEKLQRDRFGSEDPIGKVLRDPNTEEKAQGETPERVVGVIRDFRKNGEFSELKGYAIYRNTLEPVNGMQSRYLALRVRPGTSASLEERLLKRLQSEAPDWSFKIKSMDTMRNESQRESIIPLSAFGLVAGFLMIMVGLGLTGVLWQSVTQRTREIGLRRAKGATAQRIYKQILAELMVVASAALVPGIIVVVQFPLLNFLGFASPGVYAVSVILATGLIYLLTLICGLYPGMLATGVQPAEALHYE